MIQTSLHVRKNDLMHASNVLLVCPKCNKGVRVGKKIIKDKKARVCKKCNEVLDK
ncbi:MAG: hypothetical protein HYY62_03745 [Deltaproteobacteria bacterium]|nr:hypothetical protein [Deltaproteobacteria bacterium]